MAECDSASDAPLDMSGLVSVARRMLTDNRDDQPTFQDLIAKCTAVENVHHGELAHFDRVFKNTFVTDAEFDAITQIIPVDVGCPDSISAMDSAIEHEVRILFALFLLQAIAGDTTNTAVLLASDHGVHPLLKLQSCVRRAQQTEQIGFPFHTQEHSSGFCPTAQPSFFLLYRCDEKTAVVSEWEASLQHGTPRCGCLGCHSKARVHGRHR